MGLSKKILSLALRVVSACTFWIRLQKNRITFVSLTQDHLDQDFALLDAELKKRGTYEIHYNLIRYRNSLKDSALYFFNCLKQVIDYKKSALVILNDNNYVISGFKPAHLKVLQIWHACGAVKKFGNQIRRQYPIQGYDAVLASSSYWKEPFSEAFGVSCSQVYPTGLPRNDLLLNQPEQQAAVQEFLSRHPELRGKRIVLYAPTFRGNIIDGLRADSFDLSAVLDALDENTWILCKFHPLLEKQPVSHPRALDVSAEDLYMLMELSDALISDYSSVIFDYALLDKPMISYIDDLETYSQTIGLNMDYLADFPGPVTRTEEELVQALSDLQPDPERMERFRNRYIVHRDGRNTQRVAALVDTLMDSCKQEDAGLQ